MGNGVGVGVDTAVGVGVGVEVGTGVGVGIGVGVAVGLWVGVAVSCGVCVVVAGGVGVNVATGVGVLAGSSLHAARRIAVATHIRTMHTTKRQASGILSPNKRRVTIIPYPLPSGVLNSHSTLHQLTQEDRHLVSSKSSQLGIPRTSCRCL